jgi:hypothetical protein
VAVAARAIAGIAGRAISVPVMLAGRSNIAAAASDDLVLGKKVRHVGHRRCRHSHAAAQRGDDTGRETFHETGRISSDVHGNLLELETSPLLRVSRVERCRCGCNLATIAQKIVIFTAASYL